MSIRVMAAVWEVKLPPSEKLVLLALADCANDEGSCWPSATTIARKCGQGERTVRRAIHTLILKGHLTQVQRNGTSAIYTVHPCQSRTPATVAPLPIRHGTPATVAPKPSRTTNSTPIVSNETTAPALTEEHVLEAYNLTADQLGLPKAKMTLERRRKLKTFIRRHPIDDITEAIAALSRSPFLRGENDRAWRADFDFLLQPKSFTRLTEGYYER